MHSLDVVYAVAQHATSSSLSFLIRACGESLRESCDMAGSYSAFMCVHSVFPHHAVCSTRERDLLPLSGMGGRRGRKCDWRCTSTGVGPRALYSCMSPDACPLPFRMLVALSHNTQLRVLSPVAQWLLPMAVLLLLACAELVF